MPHSPEMGPHDAFHKFMKNLNTMAALRHGGKHFPDLTTLDICGAAAEFEFRLNATSS
jgi:hypothetical protein